MSILVAALIASLCLAAFAATAETALTSVGRLRMRAMAEQGDRAARRDCLVQDAEERLRRIDAFLRAAHAIEEGVADAITRPHDGLGIDVVRHADARAEIFVIGMD